MTSQGETSPAGAQPDQPPMRASDVDRLATVKVLQDGVARGLLTPDEGSDRMAAAFAAVHLHELAPLTADLPAGRTPTAPGWRPLAAMAVEQVRSSVHELRTHGPMSRPVTPARIALAVLLAAVLFTVIGSIAADLLFDGDGFDGGHGPGGFELDD